MSDKKNNRQGGKHPNSPRYSDRYGKGHVNPYLGGQPKHDTLLREIEERQNAVRRENEQEALRRTQAENIAPEIAGSAEKAAQAVPAAQPVRSTARRRSREQIIQPKAMDDPQLRERLRQIQEQAMNEARALKEDRQTDEADFDEDGSAPDVKLKLSEDNKPLIALESRGSDGRLEIRWIPVVLSDEEMEAFFPAIEPMQECRGRELEENKELKLSEESALLPDEDGLVLIPIAGLEDETEGESAADDPQATAVVEVLDAPPESTEEEQSAVDQLISELPVIEAAQPEDDAPAQDDSQPESAEEQPDAAEECAPAEGSDQPPEEDVQQPVETAEEPAEQVPETDSAADEPQEPAGGEPCQPEDTSDQQEEEDGPTEETAAEAPEDADDAENSDTDNNEENEAAQQPTEREERPRRKRRERQPAAEAGEQPVVQPVEETQPQEAEESTDGAARARRTAVAARPVYDELNANDRYAQSRYSEEEGEQDDSLFIRRRRSGGTALSALPNGGRLPNYIDDDDFVERWLGEREEEDMASENKRRRRRISTLIGAVTMVLALVGFIAIARWGIGLLSGIGNTDSQRSEYADFISPVVMSEVPVFEAWDAIPQDKLLQSAVFSVLLEMDVSYERDDTGKFIIPSTDIVNAVKELYGAYSSDPTQDEEINTQIRNALYGSAGEDTTNTDVYYVDMEDSFHVADGLSGPAPQVIDMARRDATVTLTVQYLEDLEGSSGGILYSRQYILTLKEDGGYYVQAIREYDE